MSFRPVQISPSMLKLFQNVDILGLSVALRSEESFCTRLCDDANSILKRFGIELYSDVIPLACRQRNLSEMADLPDCLSFQVIATQSGDLDTPLELRLLQYGVRPAAFVLGSPQRLRELGAAALSQGFHALLTPFAWRGSRSDSKNGYSNLMIQVPRSYEASDVRRGLIVGRNQNDVALGWLASTLGWDSLLGRVLGYPQCCIDAFTKRWPEAQANECGDLVPAIIGDSGRGPFDWRINIIVRYFGDCLLHHFPCTFNCPHSIRAAASAYESLAAKEPVNANKVASLMSSTVLYTSTAGVFLFPECEVIVMGDEWAMKYSPETMRATTTRTALYRFLSATNTLVGTGGGNLQLCEQGGALVRFGGMAHSGEAGLSCTA